MTTAAHVIPAARSGALASESDRGRRLSRREREALVVYIEADTTDEAARQMGISKVTLFKHLTAAREKYDVATFRQVIFRFALESA